MFDCDGAQSLQADDISEHDNEKPTEPGPEQRYDDESESDECDSAEEGHSVGDGHSHHSTKLCTIEADLASWAVEYHVKHNAIDGLLKILQKSGHSCLPTTARSLLNSPRNVTSTIKSGMDYIYLGLKSELLKIVKCYALTNSTIDHVEIALNIHGLPLFKSANTSLWPILCGVMNLDFLIDTTYDLNDLLCHGLSNDGRNIKVTLRCIVCDAPARAFVKCMKLYSGYYGCDKCTQKGAWKGRMTFPEVEDITLRCQTNIEHHKQVSSPFCDVTNVNMVTSFPIDYMHQVCLGVMRK
ncbi:hypothetical protein BSL78_20568 [Apostichopus japonicus]|uniref:Transposase domain-containing protein n=1 Tax=Stichopus japonicus TaxID=307972 RepID=A0A2G8K3K8_STIJA|nr:hypothetical protein BSL78_20568 [Apostichopus japonicus]